MKKFLFVVVFSLLLVSFASAKDSVLCTVVAPEGAQLEKFPTSSGQISLGQMAELGLRPVRLTEATSALNHQRNLRGCAGGTWSKEILPAGTMVLVDRDNTPRYKYDCGNRLVLVSEKAQVSPIPAPAPPAGNSVIATPVASGQKAGWMSWWTPGGLLRDIIMFLLGFALLVAFVSVLFWLLWHLFGWLYDNRPWRPFLAPMVPPAPPAPLVVPMPVVVAPVPGPVPVRTTRRYGPFMRVAVTDMGVGGFRVMADGHHLGTFNPSHAVSTEDAGLAGHYVVVTT